MNQVQSPKIRKKANSNKNLFKTLQTKKRKEFYRIPSDNSHEYYQVRT
jgi:hypothetical protein